MTAYERRVNRLRETASYYVGGPDYKALTDEELAALAAEKGINIDDMTRTKIINALKKAV